MAKKKNSEESSEEQKQKRKTKTTQLSTVTTSTDSQLPGTSNLPVTSTIVNGITEASTFPSKIDLPKTPGSTAPVVVSSSATTIPPQK